MRLRRLLGRLGSLLSRRRTLRRYDDEVHAHLAMLVEDLQGRGMSPDAARREARRRFGGVDQARERFRDASGFPLLDAIAQDVRFGIRMMRRQPGFSLLVVLLVAVGVGANTAIFSMVQAVLLRPLPYRDSGRLAVVRTVIPAMAKTYPSVPVAAGEYLRFSAQAPAFETMAAIRPVTETLTGAGAPARVEVARVTSTLLPMLGVNPVLGRLFRETPDRSDSEATVVLAYAFWQERFGGDPGVVGRTLTLDDHPYTVVGVLPATFRFPRHEELGSLVALPERLDVLRAAAFTAEERETTAGDYDWAVIGRLRPGATIAQARSQLDAVQVGIVRDMGLTLAVKTDVIPLHEQVVSHARRGLLLLAWSVGLVLLMMAVNLASLLLARVSARAHEASVRTALGANRGRIVRQIVIENLLLGGTGGVLGLLVAWIVLRTLAAGAPLDLPRLDEVALDPGMIAFGLAVALLTGLTFSALPAWRLGRAASHQTLRSGTRTSSDGVAPLRIRGVLVTLEVALSTALVAAAALLGGSFYRLLHVDSGFRVAHVVFVGLTPSATAYGTTESRTGLYDRILSGVRAVPGVTTASLISEAPLTGEAHVRTTSIEHDTRPLDQRPVMNVRYVDPGYFKAVGTPVVAGRGFDDRDRGRQVALLNARAAGTLWPGQDPVGRRFQSGNESNPFREVVGIAGDAREVSLYKAPYLMAYVPYWSDDAPLDASVVIQTDLTAGAVAPALRRAIWDVDPQMPAPTIISFSDMVDEIVAPDRFQLLLVAGFALTALVLAALGVYGVPAFAVARRGHELGIRLALGAAPAALVRMVVRQGLAPVIPGLVAGTAGAVGAGWLIQGLLFDAGGTDPWTLAVVLAVVSLIAVVACYVPARRAARVDPAQSLRAE